ncbi:MAG: hypothetical protein LAO22_10835 [Acidobacteriia bacterium]|nr:hypothetical protein [Terriglobia bacterium]
MQAAKDSFYMALRDRLAALNPARTMVVDGVALPAIVVRENMEPQFAEAQVGAFYVDWGEAQIAESTRPILGLDCQIWYASEGSVGAGVDRGRALAQMDEELLRICNPPYTGLRDYSQSPSAGLGSSIFWTMPDLAKTPGEALTKERRASPARLTRYAQLKVYFFLPEVGA